MYEMNKSIEFADFDRLISLDSDISHTYKTKIDSFSTI